MKTIGLLIASALLIGSASVSAKEKAQPTPPAEPVDQLHVPLVVWREMVEVIGQDPHVRALVDAQRVEQMEAQRQEGEKAAAAAAEAAAKGKDAKP